MFRFNGGVMIGSSSGGVTTVMQSGGQATVVRAEAGTVLRVKVNDRVVHIIDFGPAPSAAAGAESGGGDSSAPAAPQPPRTYLNAPAGGRNLTLELVPGSEGDSEGRVLNVQTDDINISVLGSVHGSVSNVSGDVVVGETVRGNVDNVSGTVSAAVIQGNVQTVSGNIDHRVSRRAPATPTNKKERSVRKAVPEPTGPSMMIGSVGVFNVF
jgi:hypothetical protein